jgi:hypothetical protein
MGIALIDHFNLPVLDLIRSRQFYTQVLAPLGVHFLVEDGSAAGFGTDTWSFGIVVCSPPIPRLHVAFQAYSSAAVDSFFRTAVEAGAQSNGTPGIREQERAPLNRIVRPPGNRHPPTHTHRRFT